MFSFRSRRFQPTTILGRGVRTLAILGLSTACLLTISGVAQANWVKKLDNPRGGYVGTTREKPNGDGWTKVAWIEFGKGESTVRLDDGASHSFRNVFEFSIAAAPGQKPSRFDAFGRLRVNGGVVKAYAIPALDQNKIVLAIKANQSADGSRAWCGGLPIVPGGNVELGSETPELTIDKELSEELHGQYKRSSEINPLQESLDSYYNRYLIYSIQVIPTSVSMGGHSSPSADSRETIGTRVIDIRTLRTLMGITSKSSDQDIFVAIARHAGVSDEAIQPERRDLLRNWNEWTARTTHTSQALLKYVKAGLVRLETESNHS